MSGSLMRAQTFMEHGRYQEAAAELTLVLAQDPEDPYVLANLAECQRELGDLKTALITARKAMAFSGEDNTGRYVVIRVLLEQNKHKEAAQLAEDGIKLDPEDEHLLAQRADALFRMRRFRESLALARQALVLDPESEYAQWIQTQCLSILRDKDAAIESSLSHLAQNPEGPAMHSHAMLLLRQGQAKEAYEAFRIALENDPTDDGAREGLKESIRGRFVLYRWLQAYSFWCQSLGRFWYIPLVIVIVGRNVLRAIGQANPALAPIVMPLGLFLLALIWGHVILGPFMNALLMGHPYGRYALHKSEVWSARYWMAAAIAILVSGIAWLLGASLLFSGALAYGIVLWLLVGLCLCFSDEKVRWGSMQIVAAVVHVITAYVAIVMLVSPPRA